MKHGGTQEERISLSGDLNKAKTERDNAAHDLDALERLQKSGSASASEVTAARQRLNSAQNQIQLLEQRQGSATPPPTSIMPGLPLKTPRQITQRRSPSLLKAMCTHPSPVPSIPCPSPAPNS